MFTVRLDQVSKKYRNEWIFKDISFDFSLEKFDKEILITNITDLSRLIWKWDF